MRAPINKSSLISPRAGDLRRRRRETRPGLVGRGVRRYKNYLSIYGRTCPLETYYRLALQSGKQSADRSPFYPPCFPKVGCEAPINLAGYCARETFSRLATTPVTRWYENPGRPPASVPKSH